MSAQSQLEAYLADFRERLKRLILARGAAVLAVAVVTMTIRFLHQLLFMKPYL